MKSYKKFVLLGRVIIRTKIFEPLRFARPLEKGTNIVSTTYCKHKRQ